MVHDPTALLTIRVWVEHGSPRPLRASVRHTTDVARGFEPGVTLTDVEATVDLVRTWLREVVPD